MSKSGTQRSSNTDSLSLGLSPCPNDTYIFHALLHGFVNPDFLGMPKLVPYIADVEQLNRSALSGSLDITKISLGVVPYIADDYVLLSAGAALGWGCGPLVVARKPMQRDEMATATIAIPGKMTTASLLLDLHGGFQGKRQEMLFSNIMPAVARGEVDIGVIIHEGRFTYPDYGLHKILDLGQWWEANFALPLPLGAIAARRDLADGIAKSVEKAIARSLEYARANPTASENFIRQNAQEMDDAVTRAHIRTFVTDYSLDLGEIGKNAISRLINEAIKLGNGTPRTDLFL